MSILDWLNKKQQKLEQSERLDIPGDLWVKCFKCSEVLYLKDLEENHKFVRNVIIIFVSHRKNAYRLFVILNLLKKQINRWVLLTS